MTATQERAGGFSANTLEYSALTNGKSAMLVMNTVDLTTFSMPAPARRARMFFRLCSVWAATPSGSLPVAGSMPSCPEQYRASPERTAWE